MIRISISDKKGFTLLETLIALSIFSLGIMGVAGLQVISMFNDDMAHKTTCLSVAAAESLEYIMAIPYDDTLLKDLDGGYFPSNPDHGPYQIDVPQSTIEWEVDDEFPTPNTKRIRITVRLTGHNGRSQSIAYDYIRSRGFL